MGKVADCSLFAHCFNLAVFTVHNEVAKVMFLRVSVCPQGGGIPACLAGGILAAGLRGVAWSGGLSAPGGVSAPGGGLLGGVCSQGRAGIPACTKADPPGETATAADVTHPTGMHSFFIINFDFSHLILHCT